MPSIIKTVTFDCADALAMARFWAAVLGTDVDEDAPRTMHAEVERLTALGATVTERFRSHTTMHDPERNVFCVELGPDDGAAG